MSDRNLRQLREDVVLYARRMYAEGLVTGTSGNISAREESANVCLVTPSGVDYDLMKPEDLVLVDLGGNVVEGQLKPSVDTMNHVAIYRARPDVGSVVHTHSTYAAAFSVVHRDIPALITESAGYLGGPVRVMEYLQGQRRRREHQEGVPRGVFRRGEREGGLPGGDPRRRRASPRRRG